MKNAIYLELIIKVEQATNGEDPIFNLGYLQAIGDVREILEKYDF
jgi:hypothetical protein